jgi:hypothetical protein
MTLSSATNAATRTVPIIPPVGAPRVTTSASSITVVAQDHRTTPAVPPAPRPQPVPTAAPSSATEAGRSALPSTTAYFELFRTCACGHSSAWHSGAFGDAWRSGQQVRGACEASAESGSAGCACRGFADAR